MIERYRKDHADKFQETPAPLEIKNTPKPNDEGVVVKGIDNMLIRFARCCNPVPGDPIVGFVTRGRGVSVHRGDCPNVESLTTDGTRMLEVEWANHKEGSYHVELEVVALYLARLMNEVMNAIFESKTDLTAVSARIDGKKLAHIHLDVRIRNLDHLRTIVERLKRLKIFIVSGVLYSSLSP